MMLTLYRALQLAETKRGRVPSNQFQSNTAYPFSPSRSLTLTSTAVSAALLSTFAAMSAHLGQPAFAVSLWLMYFSFTSVYAMHPAVCSRIFGSELGGEREEREVCRKAITDSSFLSAEHIAIGMVGSSDIVSNVLVGGVSDRLLRAAGWAGYFPCVAAASSVAVVTATAFFPDRKDDVREIGMSIDLSLSPPPHENLSLGLNCKILLTQRQSCHVTPPLVHRGQAAGRGRRLRT